MQIQACGVCHTDLHYREGGINDDFPFLLGHEAAGVVESVGRRRHRRRPRRLRHPQLAGRVRQLPGVPARRAVVLLQHAQRHAEDDARRTARCCRRRSASARSSTRRSSPPASARRSIRRRRPTTAGLLGCGVMAGLGAAMNTGGVTRGDSVAVFGCGGVGDAAIAGVARSPARRRSSPSTSTTASSSGPRSSAPRTRATRRRTDPVEYIRSVTGGNGADVCIEAIGNPTVYKQAFEARDLAGTVVLVGVPTPRPTCSSCRSSRCSVAAVR